MNNELRHHGVEGMRWGVRRYQNKDGSLTDAGKRRLYKDIKESAKDKHVPQSSSNARKLAQDYRQQIRYGSRESYKIYSKMYMDELDYSKGDPEYQSMKSAKKYADALLGKYGDKKIKNLDRDVIMTASDYLAKIIDIDADSMASRQADRGYFEQKKHSKKMQQEQEHAERHVKEIRDELDKKTYSSVDEKRKAINDAFSKKSNAFDELGEHRASDWVFQEWCNALEELED